MPIQFEARIVGLKKTRNKDGDWTEVRLEVHPNEAHELFMLPLGARLGVAAVPITDDEQPVEKPKGGELAKRAGILCGDKRFWGYLAHDSVDDTESAAAWLRYYLSIDSRAQLDHNPEAAEKFKALEAEFKAAHGMVAEQR